METLVQDEMETLVQDWIDQTVASWIDQAVAFVPRLGLALIIFVAFWIAGKILRRGVSAALSSLGPDRAEVIKLLANAGHGALLLFGAITALGTVGIDVTALVASLGLAGFAVGFALRDAISNVLAGVMVLMYRPFRVGDHIATSAGEIRTRRHWFLRPAAQPLAYRTR